MNYDFLTVEDYNTIVLNYADGFREDYLLSFSDLTSLSEGFYIIDGFITVKVGDNGLYTIYILNELFTGAFCLIEADNSSYTILDYDSNKHSLTLKLTINDEDVVNGKLLLHLANTPHFAINENPYIIENLNGFGIPTYKNSVMDIIVKNKNNERLSAGTVVLRSIDRSSGGKQCNINNGDCRLVYTSDLYSNALQVIIGNYYTVIPLKNFKSTPLITSSSYTSLYQGVMNGILSIFSQSERNIPITIKYNNKTITGKLDRGINQFNIDLSNHFEDTLNISIIVGGTKLTYKKEFNWILDTPKLVGSLYELNRNYKNLKPTVYDLTYSNSEGYVEISNDMVINYVGEETLINNSIIVKKGANVIINNLKLKSILLNNISIGNYGNLTFNDCVITTRISNEGELSCNSCEFTKNSGYSVISSNNKVKLDNCSFNYEGGLIPLYFIELEENGMLNMDYCQFNCSYTGQYVNRLSKDHSLFRLHPNTIINNIKGVDLQNNDKFPFKHNKSDIELIMREEDVTGSNGVLWCLTNSNNLYLQNIKVEEKV